MSKLPTTPSIPVSIGELMDKWVILQIKALRIDDEAKLENVLTELKTLNDHAGPYLYGPEHSRMATLVRELTQVNEQLWDIEDEIRALHREGIPQKFATFFNGDGAIGDDTSEKISRFFELAQAVYITNDRRCEIKKNINLLLSSGFVEEKSYEEY